VADPLALDLAMGRVQGPRAEERGNVMFTSTVTAGRSTAIEEQVGRSVARVGEWAAWGTVAMTLAYGAAVAASGALRAYPEGLRGRSRMS
jgi:hypothetical protein